MTDARPLFELVGPEELLPAVEAGQRALRELEPREVPAKLRRVAAYTGGRLPPPFARRLLEELDADEWLRQKTAEAWPEADPDDPDRRRAASALFLLRPPGWELRLGLLAGAGTDLEHQGELERLGRLVERLEDEAREAERRLEQAAREQREARAEADRRVEQALGRLEGVREVERSEARRVGRRLEEAEAERRALEVELDEARRRMEALRRELLRARRLPPAPGRPAAEGSVWWTRTDALQAARLLDQILAAARPPALDEDEAEESSGGQLVLPAGIRPDAPEAVDWLVGQLTPCTLVVDGYNVAFHLAPEIAIRSRLGRELARLRRRARAPLRVVVVYDSSQGGSEQRGPGRIEVRFTDRDRTADDEVAQTVAQIPGPVVVVTSDRELQARVERPGVLVLWSEALAAWIRGGR